MTAFDPGPIAARFWERAGATEPFPRRLFPTIAAILPVAVVLLPALSVAQMADWLARRGAGCLAPTPDRRLRGCLVAQRGHAFIFADGSLPEDEQRLTLAHETAHFLHHYETPREMALALVGPSILPVLDGERPALSAEKLRGAFRGVPLGVYQHTLERDQGLPDPITERLESEADLIAFELLAPASVVVARASGCDERLSVLISQFGLPPWAATRWGRWLEARRGGGDPFIARLQAARKKATDSSSKSIPHPGSTGRVSASRKP